MLTFYGTSKSRSARSLWALEELGLKYEHVPVEVAKAKSPEHLERNPNGHIPVLNDDGHYLWESMAINLYLAKKYDNGLRPRTLEAEALALQWSFWAMTEIEARLLVVLLNRMFLAEERRDPKAADEGEQHGASVRQARRETRFAVTPGAPDRDPPLPLTAARWMRRSQS